MPDAADPPAKPRRTWLPMALWTAGILLVLGMVWFAAALVSSVSQVRAALDEFRWGSVQYCGQPGVPLSLNMMANDTDMAKLITQLGGPEKAALRIRLCLHLPESWVPDRDKMVLVLAFCKQPSATEELRHRLTDDYRDTASFAAWGLANLGPAAESAVPDLLCALARTRGGEVSVPIIGALGKIGGKRAAAALPKIRELASSPDTDGEAGLHAAWAVWRLSGDRTLMLRQARNALRPDNRPEPWFLALEGLRETGPDAREAVPELSRLAAEWPSATTSLLAIPVETRDGRLAVIAFLGDMGPEALDAIPALEKAGSENDSEVRSAAAEALKKIRGNEADKRITNLPSP